MQLTDKEFSEPVLEDPPELSAAQIERVVELTGFARERVRTVIEVSGRAGLGGEMRGAITNDLLLILCAVHGLSRKQINESCCYIDVPF